MVKRTAESWRPGLSGIRLVPPVARAAAKPYAERRNPPTRYALQSRISREFHEMPGLAVTPDEAARLFGLSRDVAGRILERLADTDVLQETRTGQFILRVGTR
jgi:hypothetical protein